MSLLDLKQHLTQVKMASLGSIAEHFHCDAELMRNMLSHWVRKGCLRHFTKTAGCAKHCAKCAVADYEIYEWLQ